MNWLIKLWYAIAKLLEPKAKEAIEPSTPAIEPKAPSQSEPIQTQAAPQTVKPLWMDFATKELGVKEKPGSGNNPRVVQYHSATTLDAKQDEIAWCSSFVSWCLEQAKVKSTKNAWARSYMQWGKKLDKPVFGCIVVFTRGASSGHVAFYVGEKDGAIKCLGGNQSDEVCYSYYDKSRLLGYRWPA